MNHAAARLLKRTGPGAHMVLSRFAGEVRGLTVTVGIQGTEAAEVRQDDEGTDVTMAQIAAWNEFGVPEHNVPARPFMRTAARRFRKKWTKAFRVRLKEALLGRMTAVNAGSIVGNVARADVQATIVRGPWVPNAPYTIARKGSTRPLIDTGQMRQSIRYEVAQGGDVKDRG